MSSLPNTAPFNALHNLFGGSPADSTSQVSRFVVAERRPDSAAHVEDVAPRVLSEFGVGLANVAEPEQDESGYVVHTLEGPLLLVRAERTVTQHQDGLWSSGGALDVLTEDGTVLSTEALDQLEQDVELFSYLPVALRPTRTQLEAYAQPARRRALMAAMVSQYGIFDNPEQTVTRGSATVLPAQRLVQPTPFQSDPYKNGCRAFFSNTLAGV